MKKLSFAAAAAVVAGLVSFGSTAEAVVYCKSAGVPKGCVARPAAAAAPARATVRAATPGVGAPGVGVAPRRAAGPNAGGPVDRVGVR